MSWLTLLIPTVLIWNPALAVATLPLKGCAPWIASTHNKKLSICVASWAHHHDDDEFLTPVITASSLRFKLPASFPCTCPRQQSVRLKTKAWLYPDSWPAVAIDCNTGINGWQLTSGLNNDFFPKVWFDKLYGIWILCCNYSCYHLNIIQLNPRPSGGKMCLTSENIQMAWPPPTSPFWIT